MTDEREQYLQRALNMQLLQLRKQHLISPALAPTLPPRVIKKTAIEVTAEATHKNKHLVTEYYSAKDWRGERFSGYRHKWQDVNDETRHEFIDGKRSLASSKNASFDTSGKTIDHTCRRWNNGFFLFSMFLGAVFLTRRYRRQMLKESSSSVFNTSKRGFTSSHEFNSKHYEEIARLRRKESDDMKTFNDYSNSNNNNIYAEWKASHYDPASRPPWSVSTHSSLFNKDLLILGLPRNQYPSVIEVKEAYRRVALQFHPDRMNAKKEEGVVYFQKATEAYKSLSHTIQRYEEVVSRGDARGRGRGIGRPFRF